MHDDVAGCAVGDEGRPRPARWAAALGSILLLASTNCGGGSPSSTTDARQDMPAHLCTPGQSIACVGPAGCQGGQVCKADGSGYEPCDCGGSGGSSGGSTSSGRGGASGSSGGGVSGA